MYNIFLEIIIMCSFTVQETFIFVINVENSNLVSQFLLLKTISDTLLV